MSKAIDPEEIQKAISEIHEVFRILSDLEKSIEHDRDIALENLREAKSNYENISSKQEEDELMSDSGAMENALNMAMSMKNRAVELVIKATDKVPKVIDIISKMSIAKHRGDILLKIAGGQNERQVSLDDPNDKLKLIQQIRQQKQIEKIDKEFDDMRS